MTTRTGYAFVLILQGATFALLLYVAFVDTSAPVHICISPNLLESTAVAPTGNQHGVSQTILATNMQPGDTIGPEFITLKNAGTVAGSNLTIAFTYIENDISSNPANKSADETAAVIEVITLKYDGSSLLASVSDNNTNGYLDIQDLKNTDLSGQSGIDALASKAFEIVVKTRDVMGNDYQADGIEITMTFTLNQ